MHPPQMFINFRNDNFRRQADTTFKGICFPCSTLLNQNIKITVSYSQCHTLVKRERKKTRKKSGVLGGGGREGGGGYDVKNNNGTVF